MDHVFMKCRRGFSLVELMVSTAILAIVAVQVGVGFTGLFRLMRHSYAESEIAIAEHKMHDRILFSLNPSDPDQVPPGGLSLTNVEIRANGIFFDGDALSMNSSSPTVVPSSCLLVLDTYGHFALDNVANSYRWLTPADMFSLKTDISQIAAYTNDSKVVNIDISMCLRGEDVKRSQRVSIPILGRLQ